MPVVFNQHKTRESTLTIHHIFFDKEICLQTKQDNMKHWCDEVDIQFIPTIFFNGFQLPGAYSIGDLKYFLTE